MYEEVLKEILTKHGIDDEKLPAALSDILDYFYEDIQMRMANDLQSALIVRGIKP
ncbi:hypothetical protein [Bacillus mesophilum]|uniref:hypothetical protein n=1 Tax=Bacillus mesophilum TaxID=1071718 RepID=UPI0013763AEA|nr:hypothetical protein [Bacillus mesophilum]